MDLPEEIFRELTAGAQYLPQKGDAEGRTAPRARASLAVTLVRLNGHKLAKPTSATIRDISTRGVGLEFAEPIHVDDSFAIRLPRKDGSYLWLQCLATRWSPLDGKIYLIGARFSGIFAPPRVVENAA